MRTNKLKFTQICMMAAGTSVSPFHLRLALSGSILPYLPLMTDSSGSSPSSPNTKPEPRHHQCWYATKSGLSGPSCASDPLPEPYHTQRSAKYKVKSSKILWNSHTRNLNVFYGIFLILPLIPTYHVVSHEMKRTSSNSLRSAWWTWQISAPILCVVFLSLISPIHHQLALSGSILSYLSAHDRFCSILTILTKHQAWAPASPMLLWYKARFVRVELCFSPSANASQETKICKIHCEII